MSAPGWTVSRLPQHHPGLHDQLSPEHFFGVTWDQMGGEGQQASTETTCVSGTFPWATLSSQPLFDQCPGKLSPVAQAFLPSRTQESRADLWEEERD